MKVLVTGSAGFIGSYVANRLVLEGYSVIGIDNLNDYYGEKLKETRLSRASSEIIQIKGDISDEKFLEKVFKEHRPSVVINLAAQAGVRYSLENPKVYMESNVDGFYNVLEACKKYPVNHLIYASSSSVYGTNTQVPFKEEDRVDSQVSLYAATKKMNETLAYTYSSIYKIPISGLRFFTVYGPMGRPDMAYYSFTDKYFRNEPIKIYNNGNFDHDLYRDFTYIDDIVEGIVRLIPAPPISSSDTVPHQIYNIGNNSPVKLMDFIYTLEKALGKTLGKKISFKKEFEQIKTGDVPATFASTEKLEKTVGFKPSTPLESGLKKFTDWYVMYYNIKGE